MCVFVYIMETHTFNKLLPPAYELLFASHPFVAHSRWVSRAHFFSKVPNHPYYQIHLLWHHSGIKRVPTQSPIWAKSRRWFHFDWRAQSQSQTLQCFWTRTRMGKGYISQNPQAGCEIHGLLTQTVIFFPGSGKNYGAVKCMQNENRWVACHICQDRMSQSSWN